MELSQRQQAIFRMIVEAFIKTAEPVGSKTLMNLLEFPVSSATIRNEMAALEELGLLEKTHTSSGRVPSQLGYRYYVTHLMIKDTDIDPSIKVSLQQVFGQRQLSLDEVVKKCSTILSDMTNLTSVVLGPDSSNQHLSKIELVPINSRNAVALIVTDTGHIENKVFQFSSDVGIKDLTKCCELMNAHLAGTPINEVISRLSQIRPMMQAQLSRSEVLFEAFVTTFMKFAQEKVSVSGRSNMLVQPEFSDVNKLKRLMEILESGELFHEWTQQAHGTIPLDERHAILQMGEFSVITTKVHYRDKEDGQLMVVGPNRMEYARVVALMDYMSDMIEQVFRSGGFDDE